MSIINDNHIPEGIEKVLEAQNKLIEPLQPLLEEQRKMQELTAGLNIDTPHLQIDNQLMDAYQTVQNPELQHAFKQYSDIQANSDLMTALETLNKIDYSFIKTALENANRLNEIFYKTVSPAIQWLQSLDYNPIITFFQNK